MKQATKKKKSTKKTKNFTPPAIAVIDNIVISRKAVWAYYVLSESAYNFLSFEARINLANNTQLALGAISSSAEKRTDCHLLITNELFNPISWETQIKREQKRVESVRNLPFEKFLEEQVLSLSNNEYRRRVTYLGVKLFNRGSLSLDGINVLESGLKGGIEILKDSISLVFQIPDVEISEKEETRARKSEENVFRILSSGALSAKRPSAEDLLLTIKHRLYPSMPAPYLQVSHEDRIGLSDIMIESGGELEHRPRWVKISQYLSGEIYTGYRSSLSFSKFPESMAVNTMSEPLFYRTDILPFAVNARFTLVPREVMKKELSKKEQEAEDERKNISQAGKSPPVLFQDTMNQLQDLEAELEDSSLPWINGSYRLTIETPDEESMKKTVSAIRQRYAEDDVILSWTTGDQLQLLLEEMPGGELEMSSFSHMTNLALLGIAGINLGTYAGDPVLQIKQYKERFHEL